MSYHTLIMKLYQFTNPFAYGLDFFVMETSEERAIEALNKELRTLYSQYRVLRQWKDDSFKNYQIITHEPGQVLVVEIN